MIFYHVEPFWTTVKTIHTEGFSSCAKSCLFQHRPDSVSHSRIINPSGISHFTSSATSFTSHKGGYLNRILTGTSTHIARYETNHHCSSLSVQIILSGRLHHLLLGTSLTQSIVLPSEKDLHFVMTQNYFFLLNRFFIDWYTKWQCFQSTSHNSHITSLDV